MIRCNNCMELFESDEELSLIVNKQEFYDGDWHTTERYIYHPDMNLENTETEFYEVFKGCPFCLADEFLMDITPYKDKEEK